MDATAMATVTAAVVALVQLVKFWNVIPDRWGPLAVVVVAAVGVGLWVYSYAEAIAPFEVFASWVMIATAAAGVYGFARAAQPADVTAWRRPPSGAGDHPTRPG